MARVAIWAEIAALLAPLFLALAGWWRARREPPGARRPVSWRLFFTSSLAFALAFNLQFFIQELFLVLPKALTPGLRPTLFHNNHAWQGSNPLAELFQGTGALATFIVGLVCAAFIARVRGCTTRLVLLWMAYCGIIMALAQVVVGAMSPFSDLGRAMNYLGLSDHGKVIASLMATLAIPCVSLWLTRRLLLIGADDGGGSLARARHALFVATLPSLLALALIVPFRVPREILEVVLVPAAVILAGVPWMQAGAFHVRPGDGAPIPPGGRVVYLLGALLALLAIFQLVLRPGIDFF